jgi:hypothetical protein
MEIIPTLCTQSIFFDSSLFFSVFFNEQRNTFKFHIDKIDNILKYIFINKKK